MLLSKDSDTQESTKSKKSKKGLHALLRKLSDDEDALANTAPDVWEDPDRPWSRYYRAYVDALEQVPDGWSAIKWWGVSAHTLRRRGPILRDKNSLLSFCRLIRHAITLPGPH
jgi:hypothetical protein